jgi:hypothetical protein
MASASRFVQRFFASPFIRGSMGTPVLPFGDCGEERHFLGWRPIGQRELFFRGREIS